MVKKPGNQTFKSKSSLGGAICEGLGAPTSPGDLLFEVTLQLPLALSGLPGAFPFRLPNTSKIKPLGSTLVGWKKWDPFKWWIIKCQFKSPSSSVIPRNFFCGVQGAFWWESRIHHLSTELQWAIPPLLLRMSPARSSSSSQPRRLEKLLVASRFLNHQCQDMSP